VIDRDGIAKLESFVNEALIDKLIYLIAGNIRPTINILTYSSQWFDVQSFASNRVKDKVFINLYVFLW
jgi:hypothetical protein